MTALATLDRDASLQVCFQCHAVKDEVRQGDYSIGLPALTTRPHFPDGRIRFFSYQETHRFSACYFDGSMTCTSCHDPHSQGYRDVNGAPLGDRFADGQCLGCHPSKAAAVEQHTNHPPGSAGSRCVACHMPYLQQPNVGTALRYARSDHSIPIPRPAFDAQLGITSACRQCHSDRPITQLETDIRAWYGELKPHPELVTALFTADRAPTRLEEARRLLTNDARHPAAQAAALGHFALHRLLPDMADLEPEIVSRLKRLAEHPDVDVRALALASLHFAAGERRGVWRFLGRRLRDEGAAEAAVRARWVAALRFRGDALAAQGDAVAALATYRKAREVAPDDPQVLADEATATANVGDYRAAITLYRASLARDSGQALTRANLGIALERAGDDAGALAAFERAVAAGPLEPAVHASLGNLLQRRGRVADAARAYERAVTIDPGNSGAWFALAQAYGQLGDAGRTITALRRGLELNPTHAQARAALERLLTPARQ